jgi:hypothetical protein
MKERRKAENAAGNPGAQAIRYALPPYPTNRVLKNPPLSISSLFIIIFP